MKKAVFFLFSCFFVFSPVLLFSQNTVSLDSALKNGVSYLRSRVPQNTRVSILNIESDSPELSGYVLKNLSTALVNDGYFTVIERDAAGLSSLDGEMNYQLSGAVSDETSLFLGRQLGAEIILLGGMNPSGQGYRLDLKALQVETAQVAAQWFAEHIRLDASWASLTKPSGYVALSFTGDALSEREKQSFADILGQAFETHRVPLELSSGDGQTGYTLAVSFYSQQLPPVPPANTALLSGEFRVSLVRGSRVLRRAGPYQVVEMTLPLLVRRAAEALQRDGKFFTALKQDLNS